jgi:hypothetical protein
MPPALSLLQLQQEPSMPPVPPVLSPEQGMLLDAIRDIAAASPWKTATEKEVGQRLGRRVGHAEFRALVERGKVQALQRKNKANGEPFLVWTARDEELIPSPTDACTVRQRIEEVVIAARGDYPCALYENVRDHFLWFDSQGHDLFEPVARQLVDEGLCQFEAFTSRQGNECRVFDLTEQFGDPGLPPREEPPDPDDRDFEVLNALEDEEVRQINFGGYETATTTAWLATKLGRTTDEVRTSLVRLWKQQYLVHVGNKAVRSRMAELARLVRYVKQRFSPEDADRRPFVIRSIQVRVLNREKPARNQDLAECLAELKTQLAAVPQCGSVLGALEAMLRQVWKAPSGGPLPAAGFQVRALQALLPAYLGVGETDSFVITADTGSGKTEAACLPLIAGASIDKLRGRQGVKAAIVYPRIRLAYNQAQRLTRYLAQLARQPGAPLLTIGLQTGEVPRVFNEAYLRRAQMEDLWPWRADVKGYGFPFFGCPECGGDVMLRAGQGQAGADQLHCSACAWDFGGWVGTKDALRSSPPDFFLPVTESLHQWLHDPEAGRLFGDTPAFVAPRALLADEIHLYSHIHGVQVGYALRRFLARAWLNARAADPGARRPLAVGMSATLGEPAAVWGQLAGRDAVGELRPSEDPEAHEREADPRGRE